MKPAKTRWGIGVALLLAQLEPLGATTRTVTNLNDSGAGSLRDAIAIAASGDTIVFAVTGTITLFSGSLQINKNLTISGPGPPSLTIQRDTAPDAFQYRIFYFDNGTFSLSGLTISNGNDPSLGDGGGIYNQNGNLTVSNCVITGNTAGSTGGGILNLATMSLQDCTISNNTAGTCSAHGCGLGGGINNGGTLTMTNCVVTGNHSSNAGNESNLGGGGGGGIENYGSLTMTSCVVSNNTAQFHGGGIANYGEPGGVSATLTNCTFSQNHCTNGSGGAIRNYTEHFFDAASATLMANGCIFNGNSAFAGGAVANSSDTSDTVSATFQNCTFSANTANVQGGLSNSASGSATLTVRNCTLSGNSSSSGSSNISNSSGVVNLGSTILKKGGTAPNLSGTMTSEGYNLCDDNGSGMLNGSFDQINTDPQFDPLGLQNNGGPTKTIALVTGSPALDRGNRFGLTTDQRGAARPIDDPSVTNAFDGADVGAFESSDGGLQTGVPQYFVTTTADTDDLSCGKFGCSLREAINRANAVSGANTILFLVDGTITLNPNLGPLTVTGPLTLAGFDARSTIISGANQTQVFNFSGGPHFILGLTIRNGRIAPPPGVTATGGGLANTGTLTLSNSMLLNNQAIGAAGATPGANGDVAQGGGVYNGASGVLTLNQCTIAGGNAVGGPGANNSGFTFGGKGGVAKGGGVFNAGSLAMNNCTVSGNTATGGSGASNSAGFGGDGAYADGGGVDTVGALTLTACTIANNTGLGGAGGNGNSVAHNGLPGSGFGGIKRDASTVTIRNCIAAFNTGGGNGASDVAGDFVSQGYNFIRNADGGTGFTATGDQKGNTGAPLNPIIGPLQNNGGPTDTIALLVGSPAIDAGNSFGLIRDQRLLLRPNDHPLIANVPGGDGSDIGAFEFGAVFLVNTLTDHTDGACDTIDCTLREAIAAANAQVGDEFIRFDPQLTSTAPGIIQLGSALPALTGNTYIQGPGADRLTVRRDIGGDYRIFNISNGTASGPFVSIRGLTISNGKVGTQTTVDGGAGIFADRSVLDLEYCALTGNSANGNGAAVLISNRSTNDLSTIFNSTLNGNTSSGGAGGALAVSSASVGVRNCTFSGNSAINGGALWMDQLASNVAFVALESSTFSGNSASSHGSDISKTAVGNAELHLYNSIFNDGTNGSVHSFGTAPLSDGNNLARDNGGGYLIGPGDIINANPLLGPLAFNGGPTQTHALLAGSPAINAGGLGAQADQRDYPRIGQTDIGAFEFDSAAVRITAIQVFSDGSIQLDGKAVVNSSVTVLASPDLITGSFKSIGPATSGPFGDWHYIDISPAPPKRFYEATYP